MKLAVRALASLVACPGVVAGLLPLVIAGDGPIPAGFRVASMLPFVVGTGCLIWCVGNFFVSGRGTLAPWDPPKKLVIVGLYRFVRNPMYLSVLTVVLGWFLYFGSLWLALYFVALAVGFHLRVTRGGGAASLPAVWG